MGGGGVSRARQTIDRAPCTEDFQCLIGETVGVNMQRGTCRRRPSGPGTVRAWTAQPYKREVGVRGSPASGDCGCEAQLVP